MSMSFDHVEKLMRDGVPTLERSNYACPTHEPTVARSIPEHFGHEYSIMDRFIGERLM